MSKAVLPKHLREKIANLFEQGFSIIEIFDLVVDEAKQHTNSHEQLSRCILSITGRWGSVIKSTETKTEKDRSIPEIKQFDNDKHADIINGLSETMQEKEFEHSCHNIVMDILINYEGFTDIEGVNKVTGFTNPPFDFFGFRNNEPYLVEFKGSLNNFRTPGETQKRRLKELLKRIEKLNVALLQVKLRKGEYRVLYNDELNYLFDDGKRMPIEPIVEWIESRMRNINEKPL